MKEAAKSYYFRRGSSIGICGAPLITIGLPSEEALLLSVSRNRKKLLSKHRCNLAGECLSIFVEVDCL
jgi:hypothetical protein